MIAVLEGLLFISGDEGIELETIKNILEITDEALNLNIKNITKN